MNTMYQDPDTLLTNLVTSIQQQGAPITDFNIGSVTRTLFEAFATVLSGQSLLADQLRLDSYLASATGDALDSKAGDYLVTRKAAVAATGTIRVTRTTTGSTLFIPGGLQLATKPTPSQSSIAIATTADASMQTTDTYVDIPVQAIVGGVIGNLAATTVVVPTTALAGVQSDGGVVVQVAMTGGTDAETDDALRSRVKTEVSGRVNGTANALLAGALSVQGVSTANVLKAGDSRSDGSTVPAGSVEVYYEGASSLQPAVLSACQARSVLNQNLSVFTATAERMYAAITVTAKTGTDTTALTTSLLAAIEGVVNAVAVGGLVRYGDAITAIHDTASVLGVNVPFSDFRKYTSTPGTAGDVQMSADRYPNLADADVSIAINLV